MITKEDALKAANMSWAEIQQEYPKAIMVIDYITKHYPDDYKAISNHKMLPSLIFSDYSNHQVEEMIDKLAIFNGWVKFVPKVEAGDSHEQ